MSPSYIITNILFPPLTAGVIFSCFFSWKWGECVCVGQKVMFSNRISDNFPFKMMTQAQSEVWELYYPNNPTPRPSWPKSSLGLVTMMVKRLTSSSVGFWPIDRITPSSSLVEIVPLPSCGFNLIKILFPAPAELAKALDFTMLN